MRAKRNAWDILIIFLGHVSHNNCYKLMCFFFSWDDVSVFSFGPLSVRRYACLHKTISVHISGGKHLSGTAEGQFEQPKRIDQIQNYDARQCTQAYLTHFSTLTNVQRLQRRYRKQIRFNDKKKKHIEIVQSFVLFPPHLIGVTDFRSMLFCFGFPFLFFFPPIKTQIQLKVFLVTWSEIDFQIIYKFNFSQ